MIFRFGCVTLWLGMQAITTSANQSYLISRNQWATERQVVPFVFGSLPIVRWSDWRCGKGRSGDLDLDDDRVSIPQFARVETVRRERELSSTKSQDSLIRRDKVREIGDGGGFMGLLVGLDNRKSCFCVAPRSSYSQTTIERGMAANDVAACHS